MRPRENRTALSNLAVHHGRLCIGIHVNVVRVFGQNLDCCILAGISKDATAIVVALKGLREGDARRECIPPHRNPRRSRPAFTVVGKPLERAAATRAREEGELPTSDNFHLGIADFELAPLAAVVAPGAEAQVGSSATDELGDALVPGAVQGPAVSEVGAAREDEEGAGGRPWLFEDGGFGDGDDGVVGREEATQRVHAMADGFDGRTGSWYLSVLAASMVGGVLTCVDQDVEFSGGHCGQFRGWVA